MKQNGLILKSNGGFYDVRTADGIVTCPARGVFRHEGMRVLVGDRVLLSEDEDGRHGVQIAEVLPRHSCLSRPPMANLDRLFIVIAAARPKPILSTVDRLIALSEDCGVEPSILVTKADLDPDGAGAIAEGYRACGFETLSISAFAADERELDDCRSFLLSLIGQGIAAFAGASGVGKSSLLRALFPSLPLEVGDLSRKTDRGRQTTRIVRLFPLGDIIPDAEGYLADTPGFSVLDYMTSSRITRENLPLSFREYDPYLGKCRYTDCTHRREEGCAILAAMERGEIPAFRHESYLGMYEELKDKHPWDNNEA